MAVANGYGKTVTSGSVFMYDVGDTINSYRGEPTTNYIWHQNPRIDASYESYMPESGTGNMAALHPGAIRVYNVSGDDLSNYLNTGINISNSGVDWYNTRHAYWIYDSILKRPVVRMYNETGVWQAKYFNPQIGSLSNIGVSAGTKYVISWLQYVESLDRSAYVGLYSYSNTSGYNDFWDGLQAAYNTKTRTWQRVYAIFTATNNGQLGNYHNGYMYGQAVGSGELRIADVQLEVKTHPTQYSNSYTRSVTQGLLPLVGNSTLDLSNVSFDSNAQITFDGTDDRIITSDNLTVNGSQTLAAVAVISGGPQSPAGIISNHDYANNSNFGLNHISGDRIGISIGYTDNTREYDSKYTNYTATVGVPFYIVMTFDQPSNTVKLYVNGALDSTFVLSKTVKFTSRPIAIGRWDYQYNYYYFNGKVYTGQYYNRALTAAEVRQNYNKYKTRFNLP